MTRRGFTLFEVLIALTIVVILMGTLSSTISIAFHQKRAAEDAVNAVHDTQTVGDIFSQDVSCVTPPNPLSAGPNSLAFEIAQPLEGALSLDAGNTVASGGIQSMNLNGTATTGSYLFGPFKGDNISISFFTTGAESKTTVSSGVRYVEYRLSQQPDGRLALVRAVDSNLMADNPPANLPQEILITGVTSIAFQYFDGTGWADNWDSTATDTNNMLPYAVKMVLNLEAVRVNGPERVISRCATIWCAQKTVNESNTANDALNITDNTVAQ